MLGDTVSIGNTRDKVCISYTRLTAKVLNEKKYRIQVTDFGWLQTARTHPYTQQENNPFIKVSIMLTTLCLQRIHGRQSYGAEHESHTNKESHLYIKSTHTHFTLTRARRLLYGRPFRDVSNCYGSRITKC